MPDTRVLIYSSHSLFREGLKRILSDAPGINLIGFAQTLPEFEKLVDENQVDVTIVEQVENEHALSETISRLLSMSEMQVITVNLEEADLNVYRREQIGEATAETLIAALTKSKVKGD